MTIAGLAIPPLGCGGVTSGGPGQAIDAAGPRGDAAPGDAAPGDAAVGDAAPAARCDPSKPFGAPVVLANVNSAAVDQDADLADDLTIYFGSQRLSATASEIFVATRSSPTGAFGTPIALSAMYVDGAQSSPYLTSDRLTMYYAYLAPGGQFADIYFTTRANTTAAFQPGHPVAQVNSSVEDNDPFITEDGKFLYLDSARDRPNLDLYVAARRSDGSFDLAQPLTALNTDSADGHPRLSRDGLTIYWSSNRPDGGAQGGTDIWTATRARLSDAFASPTRVPELSSPQNESVSWLSADGCSVLLQTDRPGTGVQGLQDIWQAVKPL